MGKTLLSAFILFASFSQAQSLTQGNEPSIGSSVIMYVCDSMATDHGTVTGSAVTWDYSNIGGYEQQPAGSGTSVTKVISVLDATTTMATDSFPGATYAIDVQGALTSYYSSTATERISQGFLYEEPSLSDPIYAMFKNDAETVVTYPFSTGSTVDDAFDGYLSMIYNSLPIYETLSGTSQAKIDGDGTLALPGVSLSNVIRYKLVDTSYTTLPILGSVELVRTQFEYYDLASSNLPVFIHTKLAIQTPGGSPLIENTIVLSSVEPTYYLAISEKELDHVSVSPNPVSDVLTISGQLDPNTEVTVFDQSGRILNKIVLSNGNTIDFGSFESGIYMVRIENINGSTTKTVVKR